MPQAYKPDGYNSLAPYLIVQGAQKLIDLLMVIFDAKVTRRFYLPDGSVMHAEIQIDDSIVMVSDATATYAPNQFLLHVYVSDVDEVYRKALAAGCVSEEEPKQREGDPDRRGSFKDFAGNVWAIGTQL